MRLLNRSMLVLQAKPAYFDWVAGLDISDNEKPQDLSELQLQTASYVVDEIDSQEALEAVVTSNWRSLLRNELVGWDEFMDASPALSQNTFNDFFDVQIKLVVLDMSEQPLMRADLDVD